MGDDGGGVPTWLIVLTIATSSGFFVAYGTNLFNSGLDGKNCDPNSDILDFFGLGDCFDLMFSFIGIFFQFIFFSAFLVDIPAPLALILFLLVNVPWILLVTRLIISGVQAILTAVP